MIEDLIRYDVLVKEALRDVIKKVLNEVSKAGLPGEHHFFITFLTNMPGVKISSRLKKLYPEQMTIVVQHQYWDLKVNDTYFEISLSFNNIAEKLIVPFAAVQCFYDPHASFEAAFDLPDEEKIVLSTTEITEDDKSEVLSIEKKEDKKLNSSKIVQLDAFRRKKD